MARDKKDEDPQDMFDRLIEEAGKRNRRQKMKEEMHERLRTLASVATPIVLLFGLLNTCGS